MSGQREPAHGTLLQSRNTPGYHQCEQNKAYFTHFIFMSLSYKVNHERKKTGGCFFTHQTLYRGQKTKTAPLTDSHILST